MGTQLYEYSKAHTGFYTVKWVKYIVCEFYLNKAIFKKWKLGTMKGK